MNKRILLRIKSRYIKAVVLRHLIEAGYEAVDVLDHDDLCLKLDAYDSPFLLYLIEITDTNASDIYEETYAMKKDGPLGPIPILALVPRASSDIVSNALKSGMEDVFLLTKGKDFNKHHLLERLDQVLRRLNPPQAVKAEEELSEAMEIHQIIEHLEIELRHADRGKYPVSMLMIRFADVEASNCRKFIDRLKKILRESDRVYRLKEHTWLIVCPFTAKEFAVEVERKVFAAFEAEIGTESRHKRIYLFTAVYPRDGESLESLLDRLETGVSNSMEISNIRSPLNSLSATELEAYKSKIRQYKRFF